MNLFVVIREILYDFFVTIIYVFMTTIRFPQVIEQLQKSLKKIQHFMQIRSLKYFDFSLD